MITSAAETPSSLWISTGMPRPLSRTVQLAVALKDHFDAVAIARERFIDRIVHHFVDHVMEAGAVIGIADVHAGALADGVEALQDFDGFRVISGGLRRGCGRFDSGFFLGRGR